MKKKIGLEILESIQCLSQQNIITKEQKRDLANLIKLAMKSGNYQDVTAYLISIDVSMEQDNPFILEAIRKAEGE